jgi:prefoldin alpha subunit
MTEDQTKLEQMVLELNRYQAQADVLNANIEAVETQINQMTISGVTLDGLLKSNEGQDILVPIGSNSFVFAKLQDVRKIIIGIGADIAIESSIEKAQEIFGQRLRELRDISVTLQNQLRSSLQQVEALRSQIQEIYEQTQKK